MERLKTRTARLRQLEEFLLLKPGGMRAADISRQFNVNRRTVYRDLGFLAEQGVPLWQENGIFGIVRTRYQSTVRLTYHESVVLALAGLLLTRTFDERNPHVIAALHRLAVTLPQPFTAQLERAAVRAQSQHANHQHTAVLEAIAEGWGTGRKVQITYCPPSGEAARVRVISPYTLEATDAGVYVIGYDESTNEIRTFKLERLQSAWVLPDEYTIPEDFDPDAYLAYSWRMMTGEKPVSVALRFNADVAPYIRERTWHPSQTIEIRADGTLVVSMCIAEPREMLPWIRSWGAQVEVLSPDWLREKVAGELKNAAEIYAGGLSPRDPRIT